MELNKKKLQLTSINCNSFVRLKNNKYKRTNVGN